VLRRSDEKASSRIARAAGPSSARPAACTTRAAIRIGRVGAVATRSEPTARSATPVRNIRRRPKRSDTQPLGMTRAITVMAKAFSTHEVAAGPAAKVLWISPNEMNVTE